MACTTAAASCLTELSTREAEALLARTAKLAPDVLHYLPCAIRACDNGVKRAHLISRHRDGALLLELFTRDGVGTMIAAAPLAHLRSATIDDVGGILSIIEPLEAEGVLVRRSRERLEMEIERFVVAEHDGAIIGCAALYAFPEERAGELAALAVHPDFRREGYGEALLHEIEQRAKKRQAVAPVRADHAHVAAGSSSAASSKAIPRACPSRSAISTTGSAGRWSTKKRWPSRPCDNSRWSFVGAGCTDGADGPMHQARPGSRGPRLPALPGRARQAHLRERFEGGVAAVAASTRRCSSTRTG